MDFGLQPTTSTPLVTLSTTSNNLSETGGVTTVIATLSNSWGQPITVDLSYTGTAIGNVDYRDQHRADLDSARPNQRQRHAHRPRYE